MDQESTRKSYDAVARRYAEEIGGELAGKPLDRALLACLVELCNASDAAPIGDVGCGPGHVAAYLDTLRATVIGVDLSPGMIEVARERRPNLRFEVGSLLELPAGDSAWAGAVCAYSIIHLNADERSAAYSELARVVATGGWLLVAFHIDEGEPVRHVDEWWGQPVNLDFHFLDPADVSAGLEAAGFAVMSRTDRRPNPAVEVETRRCYLLAQRRP
jgi:ubiquinone/menaquinone biosynthesis C-methylase UbiE